MPLAGSKFCAVAPFEERCDDKGNKGQSGEKRGDRESSDEIILIVEDLDMERDSIGQTANMAADDGYGAELAHGAGVTKQDPVKQAPLYVRQSHRSERVKT